MIWGFISVCVTMCRAETTHQGDSHEKSNTDMLIIGLISLVIAVLAVMVSNAMMLPNHQVVGTVSLETSPFTSKRRRALANILAKSIRIPTISHDEDSNEQTDEDEFLKLHDLLRKEFPLVHSAKHINIETVNKYSLLYEWVGANSKLAPVVICAHLDVVPAYQAKRWQHGPFSGYIDEEKELVWGRGAIDNKHNVITQLAAIEQILGQGRQQLEQTVYFVYGHDEESGGMEGAAHLSLRLKEKLKGCSPAFVLDEGPFLIKGVVPSVNKPVALIGTMEKGSCTVKLTVDSLLPGHSSMPNPESNVGVLARAIARLEDEPFSPYMEQYIDHLCYLGSELSFWMRMVVSNRWLFRKALEKLALSIPVVAAAVRTTTAVTRVQAGEKLNTIPGEAVAWVNHRIHPLDGDLEKVLARDRKIINDSRVRVEGFGDDGQYTPPAPQTPSDTAEFRFIQKTVAQVFAAPSLPVLMIGNTDTRHYWDLFAKDSDCHIFRFTPVVFQDMSETSMFHGIDEKISFTQLGQLAHFYSHILTNLPNV